MAYQSENLIAQAREVREASGVSQRALSERAGLTQRAISRKSRAARWSRDCRAS
ncbi:helix-turn-helix domain-containing protein [Mesorhizobium sp.]|uniref:helix-turn-helix domain-containing protein n=1 Tax=Mesorhizobium sp. TaxID=1871066 RepID=UPI003421DE59